jgi:transcriptional regulator with XRE-family HTH domain
MVKKLVGERLRSLRLAKGYSQEKFAPVCGLDRTYIAGVEAGKRNISIDNLEKIANALDVSLSEFFDWNKPIQNTIILKVNDEVFILESKTELTRDIKNHIEAICRCAFDEDDSSLVDALENKITIEELYDMSVFQLAEVFEKVVKKDFGIDVTFKPIHLEVSINSKY